MSRCRCPSRTHRHLIGIEERTSPDDVLGHAAVRKAVAPIKVATMFDYLAVSGSWDGRMIEYVDHLHEHFVDPARIERGRYVAPRAPGAGARMHPESVAAHLYPGGPQWRDRQVAAPRTYHRQEYQKAREL